MTTMFAKLVRSGGGYLLLDAVAPGPSGGAYAVGNDNAGDIVVARLNSDGSLNWAKDITIPTFTPLESAAASSSNRLAIATATGPYPSSKVCVLMLDSAGALVWESVLNNCTIVPTEGVLLGSDNSVYVVVLYDGPLGSSQYDAALLKLNPTTGAITWQVGLTETSTTGFTDFEYLQRFGSMCQLSGGDIVMTMWGPGAAAYSHGHVQRISSSDGSVVWTRAIDFGSGDPSYLYPSNLHIGIDGSDNIYCAGQRHDFGSGVEYPLVKLDSSGSTLWARNVRKGSGTPIFDECWGALTADSNGVQIAGNMTSGKYGHLQVPAAGTVASGTVALSQYTPQITYTSNIVRGGQIGASILFGYSDQDGSSNFDLYIVQSVAGSGDDGTYGTTPRVTINYNLVAGTATVSTPGSWTRPSAPSFSLASDLGASVGAGTLSSSVVPPARTCAATSLGPTAQFGPDAYIRGYTRASAPSTTFGNITISRSFPNVGITPPSTTFGTAVSRRLQRATALGPTANLGTPAYTANSTRAASPVEPTTGFGTPFGTLGVPDAPTHTASSVPPRTTFGTAVATHRFTGAATGTQFGSFGTAAARLGQAAAGITPSTTFGMVRVTMRRAATSINSTVFGTPRSGAGCVASGFSGTAFGRPGLDLGSSFPATGWRGTTFGTPVCAGVRTRTRSAYFRTHFGLPQAERTAP